MPALTENGQDKNFREVTIETILLQRWKVGFKKKKRKAKPSFDEIFCRVRLILTLLLFKSSSWRFEFALQSLVIYIYILKQLNSYPFTFYYRCSRCGGGDTSWEYSLIKMKPLQLHGGSWTRGIQCFILHSSSFLLSRSVMSGLDQ